MNTFKILALDGGGARGLFSVDVLHEIEKQLNIKLNDYFDLIIGTSTGSIIAAGIAMDIDLKTVRRLYLEEMETIFKKNPFKNGIFESKYSNEHLRKILEEVFKNKKFSDVKKDLIITATNIVDGNPVVIKSKNPKNTQIVDAILSSCAAPVFFDPMKLNDEQIFSDGGLWANSPGLIGLTEALAADEYNKKLEDIRIMSIGTGEEKLKNKYENKLWGITYWYNPLIKIMLQLSTKSTHNILSKLLSEDNYIRLDYQADSVIDIDTVDKNVLDKSKKVVTENKEKIKEFFSEKTFSTPEISNKTHMTEEKENKRMGIIGRIFRRKNKN